MVNRAYAYFLFGLMIFALFLYFNVGVNYVEFDGPFKSFFNSVNEDLNFFRIEIPAYQIQNFVGDFTDVFRALGNFFGGIYNFFVMIFNTAFRVIDFVVIVSANFVTLLVNLQTSAVVAA